MLILAHWTTYQLSSWSGGLNPRRVLQVYPSDHQPWVYKPVSMIQSNGQTFVHEWKISVERLANLINSHQLQLAILCGTVDPTTAATIAEPLLTLLILPGFATLLGHTPTQICIAWRKGLF